MHKIEEQSTHFHWLDLLRFLAALTVVIVHMRGAAFVEYGALAETDKTPIVTIAYAITRVAHEAVLFFFVLSGFLVGGRAFSRIAQGTFRPTDYAIDRFVRIMLPLIPALGLTAIIRIIVDGSFDIGNLVGNIFALQGILVPPFGENNSLWSLSYEVWFYVLAYAIGLAATKKELHLPSVIMIALVACIFTSLDPIYLFCWLIGAMAYLRMPKRYSWKIMLLSCLIFLFSVAAIEINSESNSLAIERFRDYIPSSDILRILLSISIAAILQQLLFVKPKTSLMRSVDRLGTVLAASSYTLYLTHRPVIQVLWWFGLQRASDINYLTIGIYGGCVVICLMSSWLLYLCFEKHTNRVKNWVKRRNLGLNMARPRTRLIE